MIATRVSDVAKRWAMSTAVRNIVGLLLILAGLMLATWMLIGLAADPLGRLPVSLGAGALIGLGYQVAPAAQRSANRAPDRRWYRTALVTCAVALFGTAIAAALRSPSAWLALTVCTAALAIYLSERFPAGGKWPSVFLLSPVFDASMVVQMSAGGSGQHVAVGLAMFFPAAVVGVVLTVWAFMVRALSHSEYAKATEVARGVLFAWLLLILASAAWTWSGFTLGAGDSLDPLRFTIPLVTFGSVIATVTTGWTRFREARALLAAGSLEPEPTI